MQGRISKQFEDLPKCNICYETFNHSQRLPLMICNNRHIVCKYCLQHISSQQHTCPFCRQNIQFGQIMISSYILNLLPTHHVHPNVRTQIYQQRPPSVSLIYNNPNHINQLQYNNYRVLQNHQQELELPSYQQSCCNQFYNNLEPCRKAIYVVIFIFQMPFIIFDLYFSLASTDSACMDVSYQQNHFILRRWLLTMGFVGLALVVILIIAIILKITKVIGFDFLEVIQRSAIFIFICKFTIWVFVQIYLYEAIIDKFCSGGMHTYGKIQSFFYCIVVFILIIIGSIK